MFCEHGTYIKPNRGVACGACRDKKIADVPGVTAAPCVMDPYPSYIRKPGADQAHAAVDWCNTHLRPSFECAVDQLLAKVAELEAGVLDDEAIGRAALAAVQRIHGEPMSRFVPLVAGAIRAEIARRKGAQ